jgi:hypothetical protein
MRKADIVRRITDATELTQAQAEEGVDAIFDQIKGRGPPHATSCPLPRKSGWLPSVLAAC